MPGPVSRRALSSLLFLAGLALTCGPMRATALATPRTHVFVVAAWWVPALVCLGGAFATAGNRRARATLVAAALCLCGWVWLSHPVCDPIPDAEIPNFETAMSLEQRAARGEPFRRIDGRWYQCKRWIARAFFF